MNIFYGVENNSAENIEPNIILPKVGRRGYIFTLLALLVVVAGGYLVLNNPLLPVKQFKVTGDIRADQRMQILMYLAGIDGDSNDIRLIQASVESISWVESASVLRHWPNKISIDVVPQRAIALWNDVGYISSNGDVFIANYQSQIQLAKLYGPLSREAEVMRQYQSLNNTLLETGRSIAMLSLDGRGAWTLIDDLGIEVKLGKEDLLERVQRLLFIVERIDSMGRLNEVSQIDTRYSNGVAVSWQDDSGGLGLAKFIKPNRVKKL